MSHPIFSGYNGIYIAPDFIASDPEQDSERFIWRCCADLGKIVSKPIGADLVELIAKRHAGTGTKRAGYTVTIKPAKDINRNVTSPLGGPQGGCSRQGNFGDRIRLAGAGDSAIIRYKPFSESIDIDAALSDSTGVRTETFIALAHEMIHALHYLGGDRYADSVQEVSREELYTAGVGVYENTRISENAIRVEHGFPRRRCYYKDGKDFLIVGSLCDWLANPIYSSIGGSAYRTE